MAAALLLAAAPASAAASGSVVLAVTGLRSMKGNVLVCMTAKPELFTKCDKDPASKRRAVPAAQAGSIVFTDVVPGTYAIALVHDENANNKMDTGFMGLPKEGFGFSRNPAIIMGPPRFSGASFVVGAGRAETAIKVKYM
ncbi:DUF2141 domain-containing protein [Sphingomonas sp. SUN039]|uniref:DUF2141 domain-containing protein n=1 Tax=Sphingomonas sp. SUN039 TaxID=2937787 RepID=UPI0021649963|nr:DUF2141 domain-containing protein [Sphingomonas sp. SUN039]UVO55428.1 DUF2141 domain-containing protein [Sphingomonas sp. SUN039]